MSSRWLVAAVIAVAIAVPARVWSENPWETEQAALAHVQRLGQAAESASDADREASLARLGEAIGYFVERYPGNPARQQSLEREALEAYVEASDLALLRGGEVPYSVQISDLAARLEDKALLVETFEEYLQGGYGERYLVLIHYADGLARLGDGSAERHFREATYMRPAVDGVGAHYRYAVYLRDAGRPREALEVLERFSAADRRHYSHVALLRQELLHSLGADTREVDQEIAEIRARVEAGGLIRLPPPSFPSSPDEGEGR